jgi:hypothetical protein
MVGSGEADKECGHVDKWDNIRRTIDGRGGEEDKESNYKGKWKRRTRKSVKEGRNEDTVVIEGRRRKGSGEHFNGS